MAFGWAALVVLLPLAHDPGRSSGFAASAVALVTVVGLVFVRALLRDFRDIQADRLIGRETLPVAIGVARTRKILFASLAFAALTVVTSTALGATASPLGYAMLLPLVYAATCVPLFTRKAIIQGFGAELVIDAVFILAGIVATIV
jgi:4-hydroxy-3-methylbut-2-enyl diphosphate reductase